MITEDILISKKDLMKWLDREISEDDEELCMYLSNAVKNRYEYHKEIERLNNIINKLEKKFVNDNKRIKEYNIEHPERPLDNYSKYYLDKLKELKEGK